MDVHHRRPREPASSHDPTPLPAEPRRLDVAVTPETVAALQLLIDREGVSLTEAMRRLVEYGDLLARQQPGVRILVGSANSSWRTVRATHSIDVPYPRAPGDAVRPAPHTPLHLAEHWMPRGGLPPSSPDTG